MRRRLDLLHHLAAVDVGVFLSRAFNFFCGGCINMRIQPPQKKSKIDQNNPQKRRSLSDARGLFIYCLILAVALGGYAPLARFCKQKTGNFSVMRLYPEPGLDVQGKTESVLSQEELEQILSQPFHYVASGGQSFAFASADEHYVLKLFRQHLFAPRNLFFRIPLPSSWKESRERMRKKLLSKTQRAYTGYELAYEKAREETGLLCIHLTEHPQFNYEVDLTDKLGIHHRVPLNQTAFVLQYKAEPLLTRLQKLSRDELTPSIQQALTLLQTLATKGLIDRDRGLHRNIGFIENKAVLFDVGQLIEAQDPSEDGLIDAEKYLLKKISSFHSRNDSPFIGK